MVSPEYGAVIKDIITLQAQVSLGATDQALNSDVQTLNALAQAKDLTSQQLALLDQSMSNLPSPTALFGTPGFLDFATETSLQVDYVEEFNDEAAFQASASPAENSMYDSLLGPQAAKLNGETQSDNIEQAIFAVAGGSERTQAKPTDNAGAGLRRLGHLLPAVHQQHAAGPLANNPTTAKQDGITTIPALQAAWDKGNRAKLTAMQATEQFVAGNIVTRATQLQQAAQRTALTYIIITVAVLLIVLVAALLVARSLVLPLRRLRAGALDIASVQLPERVRLLSENPESAATMDVAPINVTSQDEIGQVARAFDQVHSEAVRLAGQQALLRSSFNAMFVNLSRRSQTLIERLARMIDNLEQHEDDPGPPRQPLLHGPPGHPHAPQLGEPAAARRARQPAQVVGRHTARRRGPRRDLGDRAVQPGHAEHDAGHRARRPGGLRRRAPARRAGRERHDLLAQGHPGAGHHAVPGERRRAYRGQSTRASAYPRPGWRR